ncbi:MAG: ATP-binding protein [Campylobacterota bacterium]|nr:ATP-binding protein [Campylobacterota bacterium]
MSKLIYIALFAISILVSFLYIESEKDRRVEKLTSDTITNHKHQVESVLTQYQNSAELIFNNIINTPDILNIQQLAYEAKTEKERTVYRDELHKKLQYLYENLKKSGIQQFHFHFPDSKSFLRFHKPNKFGDDLKDFRYSIDLVNSNFKNISGFEEGKIFSGYRYIFPLFNSGKHIGSVEVSVGFNVINNLSQNIYRTYEYMILDRSVIEGKVFKSEKKNYEVSKIDSNYYNESSLVVDYKKELSDSKIISLSNFENINRVLRDDNISDELQNYNSFVKYIKSNDIYYAVSFLPIKNIKGADVGYMISYKISKDYGYVLKEFKEKMLLAVLFLTLLFLFLYKLEKSKKELEFLNSNLLKMVDARTKELQTYLNIVNKHIAITSTDLSGKIVSVNDAFCRMSGYSEDKLLGKTHSIVRHPGVEKRVYESMWKSIESGKTYYGNIKNIDSSGKEYWNELKVEPIFNDISGSIESYMAVGVDISDKVMLENLIKNQEVIIQEQTKIANMQRDRAVKASESKSEFLANMSHEIRTPLNAILGFIDFLKDSSTDKKSLQYIEIISSASKMLLQIIEDILDFSKIESGKLHVELHPFNIQNEMKNILRLYDAKCSKKSINLLFTCSDNLPKCIKSDALRLKQVVSNLLSNAVKFTDENGEIELSVNFKEDILHVSVKDSGIGINEDKLENIFESFTQEDNSTTRRFGGTGLGLTISSELIRLLGGELKVKSEVGVGSEFCFELHVNSDCEDSIEKERVSSLYFDSFKALLVEDNPTNQLFMKVLLKKLKLSFDIANNGSEAVDLFSKNSYDVILMDENMPVMNGVEATKKILEIENRDELLHTPIIALTANALNGDKERFLSAGMDDYISKPVDKKLLMRSLNKFLMKGN